MKPSGTPGAFERAAASLADIGGFGDLFREGFVAFKSADLTDPRWISTVDARLPNEIAIPVPDNTGLSEAEFLDRCLTVVHETVLGAVNPDRRNTWSGHLPDGSFIASDGGGRAPRTPPPPQKRRKA